MSNVDDTLVAGSGSLPTLDAEGPALIAGRYRIERLLGVGGMGRVYEVHDQELGESVAFKVMRPEMLSSEQAVQRFRKEVRLARKVTHRNVARIFDIGEDAGQLFMTMEMVKGTSLSDLLRERGQLSVDEALRLFLPMCHGVAAAHEQGIVHRDLKPGNVLLEEGGRVVVTDFGLARSGADGDGQLTMGQVLGTPAYMAPEQVAALEIGPGADVYALGLILFEMLAGRPAWQGPSPVMVAAMRMMEDAPSLAELDAGVPGPVAETVARCLEREPAARFEDAGALLETLERISGAPPETSGSFPSITPGTTRTKSVAVFPFRNLGGEESSAAAVGLAEDLLDVLASTGRLRVRHGATADGDPLAEGQRLEVDVVVVGSVRRRGDKLRISVRALGVADGYQLWGERFERPVREALELNDDVARAVANALAVEGPRHGRAGLDDSRAADLYLELRDTTNRSFMAEFRTDECKRLLDEIEAENPTNPQLLAYWLASKSRIGSLFDRLEVTPSMDIALQRTLSSAPNLASTWHAKATVEFFGRGQPAAAVLSLRQALRLNPGHAESHSMLSFLLHEAGLLDEATEHARQALWIEPSQHRNRVLLMACMAAQQRWDDIVEIVESVPASSWPIQGELATSRYSWACGRWLWVEPPQPSPPEDFQPGQMGAEVFLRVLDGKHLEERIEMMLGPAPEGARAHGFLRQIFAEAAAYLGEHELAWRLVQQSVEAGIIDCRWIPNHPLLAEVRARPEAAALIEIVNERARPLVEAYRAELG